MALLLFIFACLDHATSNAAQLRVSFPFRLSSALAALRHFAAFYALVPLVVAVCLDRTVFKRRLADEPAVTLPAERRGKLGMITLALEHLTKPDFLRDLRSYALERRSFVWCKTLNPSDKSLPIDRARLVAMGAILERNGSMSSSAIVTHLSLAPSSPSNQRKLARTLQRLLVFLFVIPPLLFFVIGDFPFTARLQNAFATPIVFHTLIYLLIASTMRQVGILVGQALALSDMRNNESAQTAILYGLSLSTTVGALVFSVMSLVALPNHGPLQQISQYSNTWFNWAVSKILTATQLSFANLAIANALPMFLTTMGTPGEALLGGTVGKILSLFQSSPIDFLPILNPKNWFAENSGNTLIETHQDKDLLDDIDRINKVNDK